MDFAKPGTLVRTLRQFVDMLRSLGMLAHPEVLPGVFLPSPAWAQRWRACLVQVLHLDGQPIVLYPRCPAHWMDVVSRLSRDLLVKTCKTTKYPPLCGGYRLPLLRSITHTVTVSRLQRSNANETHAGSLHFD